jgi:hypothetical protein
LHFRDVTIFPTSLREKFKREECRQVIETQERETGIEPATSSLGNWASIESKEQSRTTAASISIQNAGVLAFPTSVQFNWAAIGLQQSLLQLFRHGTDQVSCEEILW